MRPVDVQCLNRLGCQVVRHGAFEQVRPTGLRKRLNLGSGDVSGNVFAVSRREQVENELLVDEPCIESGLFRHHKMMAWPRTRPG
jgi:hypothetical protein